MNGRGWTINPLCLQKTWPGLIMHRRLFIASAAAEGLKRHYGLRFLEAPLWAFLAASAIFHRGSRVCVCAKKRLFFFLSFIWCEKVAHKAGVARPWHWIWNTECAFNTLPCTFFHRWKNPIKWRAARYETFNGPACWLLKTGSSSG